MGWGGFRDLGAPAGGPCTWTGRLLPLPAGGRAGLQWAGGGPGPVGQQRPGLCSCQEPRAGGARKGQEVVCGEWRRGRGCAMWLCLRFLLWKPDSCGRGPGSPFPRGQLEQLQALARQGREDMLRGGATLGLRNPTRPQGRVVAPPARGRRACGRMSPRRPGPG